ncbi:MAG TPA: SBBP repeat-containing protein [Blastocatellia bacterium]|nr:SBBP repeat-containing protein [Blastocatellia bacterium]
MFTHTSFAPFATRRSIIFVLIAIALAGVGFAVLWRGQIVSGMPGSSASSASQSASPAGQEDEAATKDRIKRQYGRLPMNFEVNQGQADDSVKFLSRGRGYQVFLTDNEAALVLQSSGSSGGGWDENSNSVGAPDSAPPILRMKPVGAQAGRITGYDLMPTKSNYLIGDDPSRWRTGVPNYARVEYSEIYPGINLAFYGTQQALEYDFIVAPGADPNNITLSIEGADSVELEDNGDLVLRVGGEKVYHRSPLTYQDDPQRAGAKRSVNSRYVLKGGNQIGFAVEDYDASRPLVIDPVVDFSTFFGGIGSDEGLAIAVDNQNNAYVTGATYSNNFNTFLPLQTINRGGKFDAFVTKINAAGSALVYSTYLGGGGEDSGRGIAVDSSGNAFVAGITNSPDFNIRNAFQPTITGAAEDAFVAKISADGTNLLFSSYLGGSDIDQAFGIALDSAGNAYVTGSTSSTNFRIVAPAFQSTNASNPNDPNARFDVFVTKVRSDGAQLIYSTYLGGAGFDEGYGITVDSSGSAYVTGTTSSTNFKLSSALQPTIAGNSDAFVTKLNPQGSALTFSTYVGGSGLDVAYDVAVGSTGDVYITGHTFSTNYPITSNALQDTSRGNADAFVTQINASGDVIDYSTYLGGDQGDFGRGIAVDSNLNVYITGRTASTNFPTNGAVQLSNRGGLDAFVAKLDTGSSQLVYSTYLGGADDDLGFGIAIDSTGAAYVMGQTRSTNFNTRNPLQAANRGGIDAFVSKVSATGSTLTYSTYLGGAGDDLALGIALDISGNAYITGFTSSNDYATQSPIQAVSKGGLEVFITKVFADASSIVFNTYFGGNGSDVGNAIAVDSGGSCYVTGSTTSTNLPTRTPFQPVNRGTLDAFVAKFNASGSLIIYSSYLGGSFGEVGRGIAVDLAGNAFITGTTFSDNFTTTSGAFQTTNRGQGDAFVTRVNAAGTALVYSSFLGGGGADEGAGIDIDDAGNAYIVGNTASADFRTQSPLQANNRGQQDAFVTKVNSTGSALVYSTYLGGQRSDVGNSIAVDNTGAVYITGSTGSFNDFPLRNPAQPTYGGSDLDAFVTKINAAGSALLASTYLGGNLSEVGNSIAIDSFGNIYITGVTNSTNFPTVNPIQAQNRGGNEAFITKFGPSGSALVYSTYLGGSNDDRGSALAVDSLGTAYVSGATSSPNFNIQFPLVPYGGGADVFVAKLISEASISLSPPSLELQPQATATMTVTISAPQTAAQIVNLTSSNTAVATVPQTVTIPSGAASANFTVTAVAIGGPVTITASLPQPQGGASATSTVTVVASNRFIRAASVSTASGSQLTLPIELVSQGNENRLSFSLSLDTALLLNPQFTLGADAIDATLNINSSQANQGRFGVTLVLPAGQSFNAGTRQILVMQAAVLTGAPMTTTMVAFTDAPTVRRVADVNNATLSANYTPGTVTIAPAAQGFEGDVSPRPNGSNGTVTISDWVQTGRFAAGFDTPAAGSEFQRADTAPRSTLGNGSVTISDWVQTGRYASGLDPITPAGGPTTTSLSFTESRVAGRESRIENRGSRIADRWSQPKTILDLQPAAFNLRSSIFDLQSSTFDSQSAVLNLQSQTRTVRVASATGQRGAQIMVTVELDSLGDENAIGFSLNFNPNDLAFVDAVAGPDANVSGAMFNTNTMQAANGRIGVAIALATGQTFAAGNRKIVTLTFNIPANGSAMTIPIMFGDQPVAREVVNSAANVLQAAFEPGNVRIRSVASVSAASFQGGDLSPEQIVAAFGVSMATMTAFGTDTEPNTPGIQLPTNLVGTTVSVRDSLGVSRLAPLFFVSALQLNYLMPPGTALGPAVVTVTSGDGLVSIGAVTIANVSPGIFTANSSGAGFPAGSLLRVKPDNSQISEPIARFDQATNMFVPIPIDLGPEGDLVFIILFGTGWRAANGAPNNAATIGGVNAPVSFLGQQGFLVGLDQGNIFIPRSLAGRGDVDLILNAAGKPSNTVRLNIK